MAAQNKPGTGKDISPLENVSETLSKAEQFFEKYKKQINYGITGVLVIVLGILLYVKYVRQPKINEAYEQMFLAEYYFRIDSLDLAMNGIDGQFMGFQEIVDEYGGTPAGNLARYYLGMIYMKKGQYEEAIEYLKKFSSDDYILSSMANGAIGDAYVELGKLEKALKYYLRAAEKRKNYFSTPIFYAKAAWVYEQLGNYDRAIELYRRIKEDYPRSFESREAEKNIAFLETKKMFHNQ